jgi:cytochrome c-type biogenesis protein CcmH/NrfF
MEDEPLQKLEENASVWAEGSRNPKINQKNLKKLHVQRLFWKPNKKNDFCWTFYYVNDNKEVDLTSLQVMHCIICQKSSILNLNPKIQTRIRNLIISNTTDGITTLRKHVNPDHCNIFFNFQKEVNSLLR